MKLRMGVLKFQNEALTYRTVLTLYGMIEEEWLMSTTAEHQERLEGLMSFIVICFGPDLRCEEISLVVSQRGLLYF